jgi:O-antigen ligase
MTVTGLCFVLAFFAGLVLAFVRSPMFGMATYVGVFYLHPPSRWWGEFLPDLRWSLLAAAVTIFVTARYQPQGNRPPWYSTTPAKLLIAYTIWLWIQYPWALEKVKHLECAVIFTKYLLVYWVFYRLVDTPEKARMFFLMHLAGCAYLGIVALGSATGGRLDGVGGPGIDDSNTLGMHIGTGAIIGVALMLREKREWLAGVAAATALAMNTLIMTGSRGAFLALVAGGLVLFYLHPREYRKRFLLMGAVGVFAFGALASQEFWERMNTLNAVVDEEEQLESSAQSRIAIAQAQLEMAKHYPLGNGHRGFEVLSAEYLDPIWLTEGGARSSHNTFLTTLVEQGIPGALMFFGYVIWGARSMFRIRPLSLSQARNDVALYGAAGCAGLMVVLVGGMFADFLKVEIQIWLAAVLTSLLQMADAASEKHARKTQGVTKPRMRAHARLAR